MKLFKKIMKWVLKNELKFSRLEEMYEKDCGAAIQLPSLNFLSQIDENSNHRREQITNEKRI
jgi:hypothetical protein